MKCAGQLQPSPVFYSRIENYNRCNIFQKPENLFNFSGINIFMSEEDNIKKPKDFWDVLNVISKFTTSFLLIIIAFVLDIGSKRIAQSNEESKIIQSLIQDLTTKKEEGRSDVALLALEKYLIYKDPDSTENTYKINRQFMQQVSESILRQRIQEDSGFLPQSSIPFRLWTKYDSVSASQFFTDYYQNKRDASLPVMHALNVTETSLADIQPVSQSKDAAEASVISSFNKKICYIQYNNKSNNTQVKAFQDTLKNRSWIAPGIDFVEGNYTNTVKYFNDADTALAKRAAALAKGVFGGDFKIVAVLASQYKVPKGQLEVWVNNR